MKRRLAWRVMIREERFRWNPRWLAGWAFDYLLNHGTPATLTVGPRSPYTIEINPEPKTWASGTTAIVTFPLRPDNPYA